MLGWNVRVDEVDEDETSSVIASWYAGPSFLTEMENLVGEDEAFLVESNGGYPYKFEVYSDILRDWLEDADPKLHCLRDGRGLYKLTVDYDKLDHVMDGVLLSVEMWDQS